MKKLTKSALWVLTISLTALFSCNDSSVIGSDLLSGDQLDIEFTDTLTLRARTVNYDSSVVWGPGINGVTYQNFTFGDFQDPIFGRTVSSIYAQVFTNTTAPNFPSNAVLDSVVLMLGYTPSLCYGKLDEPFTMEVYELDESLDAAAKYYTTDSFSVKPTPIGVHTFVPNISDSLTIIQPVADSLDTIELAPHLRIRLDQAFGQRIFDLDSITLVDDSSFIQAFKGIWLKPASQNAGLLSFNIRNQYTSNIRFYYHVDTLYRHYDFKVFSGNPVVMHQRNYYGGSFVNQYISAEGEERNDSLLFLQGLDGVNIEFEVPYSEALNGLIVNKAELILPIISLTEDSDDFDPVSQIYAAEILTDTSVSVVDDIYFASIRYPSDDFGSYFGGKPTTDDNYKLSLSAHFQKMIAGDAGKKMLFTAYLRSERAARVVLGGPTHATNPAKLRVSFTKY